MSRRIYNSIVVLLIGLGVVGFLVMVITNPVRILEWVAIAAAIIAIFAFLYRRFLNKTAGNLVSGYRRAAKQSLKLRKKQARKSRRPSHLKLVNSRRFLPKSMKDANLQKRKKEHNFTVIDGKKSKKKNRALF